MSLAGPSAGSVRDLTTCARSQAWWLRPRDMVQDHRGTGRSLVDTPRSMIEALSEAHGGSVPWTRREAVPRGPAGRHCPVDPAGEPCHRGPADTCREAPPGGTAGRHCPLWTLPGGRAVDARPGGTVPWTPAGRPCHRGPAGRPRRGHRRVDPAGRRWHPSSSPPTRTVAGDTSVRSPARQPAPTTTSTSGAPRSPAARGVAARAALQCTVNTWAIDLVPPSPVA